MHGIILKGLKDFVVEHYDRDAWQSVQSGADVENRLYMPVADYPDRDVMELVGSAVELTGTDPTELQYQFGRYLVPTLLEVYGVHVEDTWSGIEMLANTEEAIHRALRAKAISEFTPPELETGRLDDDTVVIRYSSDRQLCPVARGIIDGIGDHYDEEYRITERQCMKHDADYCEIVAHRTSVPTGPGGRAASDD